jgi:uncharacterized membrane protein YhhN
MTFSTISIIFLSLFIGLSAVNCSKLKYRAGGKVEVFTKPLILISLLFFYSAMLKANVPAPQRQWDIKTAMIFYAIGDFCLIWKDKVKVFALGILSFVIGHVFYSFFFLKIKVHHSLIASAIAVILLIPCVLLLRRKLSKTDDPMADKMLPYGLFIMFLIASIASTFSSGHFWGSFVATAGGALFALSDSMIGIRVTGQKILPGESIMITYTAAQLCLVAGALLIQL